MALILGITIPIAVICKYLIHNLVIVAIGILIYCKYKKSSDVIEKKINEDGITGNDYELSHDVTGKPLDSKL